MDETNSKLKRKGPDFIVTLANILTALSWVMIVASLYIYSIAEPATSVYESIRFAVMNMDTAMFAIELLLFLNIFIAICGIVANFMRNKRKTDMFHTSLVVSSLISLIAIIFLI